MNYNSCTRLTLLAELLLLDGSRGSPLYYTSFLSLPMYVYALNIILLFLVCFHRCVHWLIDSITRKK